MNTEPEKKGDTTGAVPQDTTFSNITTTLNRGEALFKILQNFSAAALQNLQVFRLSQLANPDILTAMDIYDRPVAEVEELLCKRKIRFEKITVSPEQTYTLRKLMAMAWNIAPNSQVELLIHEKGEKQVVIGIRILGGRSDEPG